MRYKSPTSEKVTISADDGTTAIVGPKFAKLPEQFHKDALAHGLIAEDKPTKPRGKPVPAQTTHSAGRATTNAKRK